jgi:murein L,D-transpeptidase YcbB/YkuD
MSGSACFRSVVVRMMRSRFQQREKVAMCPATMRGRMDQAIALASVPVYILYGTAVIDHDDALFFDDIYGYDARLDALLGRAGR